MVERERYVAPLEEDDHVIEVLLRSTACGNDYRPPGRSNLLQQYPVVHVRACYFDDREVELDAKINGIFIERRRHGDASAIFHLLDHPREIVAGELRCLCFLHVTQGLVALEIW